MTRRTSIIIRPEDERRLDTLGIGPTEALRSALDRLEHERATGDLWVGTGNWRGWRLTTGHSAASYGEPVLVRPDGSALGPGDLARRKAPLCEACLERGEERPAEFLCHRNKDPYNNDTDNLIGLCRNCMKVAP